MSPNLLLRQTGRALTAAVLLLVALRAGATGSFTVNPVRIELRGGQTSASIEVVNLASTPSQLTVERFLWSGGPEGEALTPTTDFVASPPLFDLEPGGRQVVRILLLRPADPLRQLTYRLALQESPPAQPPTSGVVTVLRMSLPIFVTPPTAGASLQWRRVEAPGGPTLEVTNLGNATAQLLGVRVDGERTLDGSAGYVLPGQVRRIRAPALGRSIEVLLAGGSAQVVELDPAR
jgi:fimbrial chaperone protein